MGNALPFEQGTAPNRTNDLRARVESLVSMKRRFPRTVPISDEIDSALPFRGLPLGCVHEVQSRGFACGITFASLLAARVPAAEGQLVYVAPDSGFHPLGLLPYGIPPERWVHVAVRNPLDLAWTVLEVLRCPRVSVVLAMIQRADLTLCRRFQLAAESSGATGFLLTDPAAKPAIASVITRWQITSIPAVADATFEEPCWTIDLAYCRGGHPARWTAMWRERRLKPISAPAIMTVPRPMQREVFPATERLAV